MAAVHYPGTPGTILYGGRAAVAPGSDLTTLTLQNESASAQAAGFVSPMFGMPFKQGDMPAGSYPRFELTDGTPCPASLWGITSWPDGSMKFCSAMIRVPAAVPGPGTLAITVKSGGIAPGASARSTADLTSADLKVEVTGITNLSGIWVASLNDAIADGSDIVVIGDGPAGKVWRIGGHFRQAGAPHGQLYCWHYVTALQDSSGGLLGLRYLGRAAQPFADVTSPTPTRRVLTAALKSSAATLRALQGHDSTETVGANIGMPHYTSFFTAGTDGRWDFVQGGGSASADCTVRVVHDKTYVVKSRLVPSYDMTASPTSGASVDYYPYGRGMMYRDMGATGERPDIGVLPSWAVRHLFTGAGVDERACRVNGLCSGGWRTAIRRSATKVIPSVTDPAPSYAGMGAMQTTWRYFPGAEVSGVVDPTANTTLWFSETESSHRPAASFYPYLITGEPQYLDLLVEQAAGLVLANVAGGRTMTSTLPVTTTTIFANADYGERNVVIGGITYKGGGYLFYGNLVRVTAWAARDLADAAAIYPDVCPQSTEVRKYFRDIFGAGCTAINAYNSVLGSTWNDSGIYNFDARTESNNPWCSGYMSLSVCHASSVLPSAEVNTFRQHLANHWKDINAVSDLAGAVSYLGNTYDQTNTRVVTSGEMLFYIPTTLVFSTATNRFTVGAVGAYDMSAWSPTNGDVIALDTSPSDQFPDTTKPFVEATNRRRLHVVNASGNTAQLSLTPGGAPLTVTTNISFRGVWARLQSFSPYWSAEKNNSANDSYLATISAAVKSHVASGDLDMSSVLTKVNALVSSAGIDFTSDPKNAVSSSYPV